MIDYPVVSIYTRNEFGNSSIVKFGGWDESALKNGTSLRMYRLGNDTEGSNLALVVRNISIGNLTFLGGDLNKQEQVHFNPAVPFVYASESDFTTLKQALIANYTNSTGFKCDSDD